MKQNTKRLYSMIFALLFIVLALVAYFDLLAPAYADLQNSKGNEISEQSLLTNEKAVVGQIQNLLATYENQTSSQQLVNAALPVGQNLAGALAQLYGISAANNVAIQSVGISSQLSQVSSGAGSQTGVAGAASTGQIVKPIGTLTFTLNVVGSYENFKSFLMMLESNMRLFEVVQLSVQPLAANGKGSSGDLFTYSITASTYYQSP